MKPSALSLPGYKVNEYLLVLSPHEALRNKIKEIKEEFFQKYQSPTVRWGKPHITLVRFQQYAMTEERIVNRLQTVAMGYYPFKVELKDFGSFPSHTIFINVTTKEPVRSLVRELRPFQQLLKLNTENKPHFIDEPHLPIARKLIPWQYEKGWLEYSRKHFTGRFIADGMLLLRRQLGGDKNYQVLKRFEFMNLPVSTRQGELFG
ncbi:MAG: 2'-5' RNA ligase family protein [Bacteroidota bacterium]